MIDMFLAQAVWAKGDRDVVGFTLQRTRTREAHETVERGEWERGER
jgi:hypothetical protein